MTPLQHSHCNNPLNHRRSVVLTLLAFYSLALPLILLNYNEGRGFYDQWHFHWPVIQAFMQCIDISDYHTASTPGYHIILASLGRLIGPHEVVLKLFSSLFTGLLLAVLARFLSRYFDYRHCLMLLLPVICSLYVFPGGVWLLPDNLAWLTVALLVLLTSDMPISKRHYGLAGLVLISAMSVRQSNLWLAVILWGMALANWCYQRRDNGARYYNWLAVIVTLPAIVLFYALYVYWGGLVPPSFQKIHQHISYSTPGFFFSLFAVYSVFYLPLMLNTLRHKLSQPYAKHWVVCGLVLGFVAVIFVDSDYNHREGRFSGLWNLIKVTPMIGDKSLLLMLLSTLGGGIFTALSLLLKPQQRLVIVLATIAFLLSQIANKFVYERYFSGYIFILLLLFVSRTQVSGEEQANRWLWAGPFVFSLINALILFKGLTQGWLPPQS